MKAEMNIVIREDGSLVITTGDLQGEHHAKADEFMAMVEKLMGGPVEVKSTKGHHHSHTHQHGEHWHTH